MNRGSKRQSYILRLDEIISSDEISDETRNTVIELFEEFASEMEDGFNEVVNTIESVSYDKMECIGEARDIASDLAFSLY